jgi:hypothetical protein
MCAERLAEYRFRSQGNNHWRVINDVYQSFYLDRHRGSGFCELYFSIVPLCYGIPKSARLSSYNYHQAYAMPDNNWDGGQWKYDVNSTQSIDTCLDAVLNCIETSLIPYFNRGSNTASAYEEQRKLYSFILKQQNKVFDENGPICSVPDFYMVLKTRNYELAEQYVIRFLSLYKQWLQEMRENAKCPADCVEFENARIAKWEDILNHIMCRDDDYFSNLIEENERVSKNNLGVR